MHRDDPPGRASRAGPQLAAAALDILAGRLPQLGQHPPPVQVAGALIVVGAVMALGLRKR